MAYFSLFFLWTVLLAGTCAVDEDNPVEMIIDPGSGLFTTTTRVSLRCLYTSDYVFDSFVHPMYGQIQTSQDRENYRVEQFPNDVSLEILAPSEVDDGLYFCTFDHVTDNSRRHASGTLTYQEHVVILSQQTRYEAVDGESVTLTCETEHATSVQWSANQRTVTSTDRITSEGGLLTFSPVRLEDEGQYTCVVANDVSLETLDVELVVRQRPTTVASPDRVIVDKGDSAEFRCDVTGVPLPTVKWVELSSGAVVGGEQVTTVMVNDTTLWSRLTFSNVTAGDIGSYRCEANNMAGTTESRVILDLLGTLDAIQDVKLRLVDQTNINVTWSRPRGPVISYTVTWLAASSDIPQKVVLNGSEPPTTYLITGLERLTMYSVYVFGSNDKGRGVDSEHVNISTDAVAPIGEVGLSLFDLAPTSVEVDFDLDSVDNGGADVTRFRLLYAAQGQMSQTVIVDGPGPILLPELNHNTQYQLQVQPGNRIGFGPVSQAVSFTTSPEGYPGSPSHVTMLQSNESSISLCWQPSMVGDPFLHYTITGVLSSGEMREWTVGVEDLKPSMTECATGFTVAELTPETCYQFSLTVTNSEGTGQSSDLLEQACTQPRLILSTPPAGEQQSEMSVIIAAVVVGLLLAVGVLVLALLCCCCCIKLRQRAKFNLPDMDRRESARSDTNLMTYQHQISSGSSSSDGSPQTASTQVSNPFIFTTSPHSDVQFYYNGTGAVGPAGSNTLGPPTYPSPPVQQMQPRSANSLPAYYASEQPPPLPLPRNQSDFEMIDNPYYKKFQLHKIPEHEEHINFAYVSVPVTGAPGNTGHTLPMCYGDDASEVAPSELSSIQMGESCSQPSMSPKLKKKKKHKHSPNHTSQQQQAYPAVVDGGTDFTDNNAYETIPHALGGGLSNGHNIYSSDMDLESEPRFEIHSQERGAVKETVQFRL